jgi:hypothetical protein
MNKICCFCEIELENHAIFCPNCLEYKGIMTIEEFENYYGERIY